MHLPFVFGYMNSFVSECRWVLPSVRFVLTVGPCAPSRASCAGDPNLLVATGVLIWRLALARPERSLVGGHASLLRMMQARS